jgi:MarR family transcriptional regulator, transcriptional regulator for hemolysin
MASTPATHVDLVLYLSQASHALTLELTAGLAELGITPRHQCVLDKALPGDLTQNRLAELAALDKTTMVVTVDELERAGYAERRTSLTDRRARVISVTDAGKEVLAKAQAIVARVYGEVLSALPAEQRSAFVSALVTLVEGRLSTHAVVDKPVRRPRAPKLR